MKNLSDSKIQGLAALTMERIPWEPFCSYSCWHRADTWIVLDLALALFVEELT